MAIVKVLLRVAKMQGCPWPWFKEMHRVHESRQRKRWPWLVTLGRLLPSQENMGGELLMVAPLELGAEGLKQSLAHSCGPT